MAGKTKRHQTERQKGRLLDEFETRGRCATLLHLAEKLRDVLREFKTSTEAVGLGIHPDKTKILSNQDKEKAKEIMVDNIKIEVLAKGDSARYLGQKITFEEQETEEIKNRLKAAWAAFHKYRQELTSKDYRLCHRLRLFSMVITPTLTYASGTWTLQQKHERMTKTAQRKMLRLIVQTKRKYKSKTKKEAADKTEEQKVKYEEEEKKCATDKETEEGSDQNSNKDQDSDVSFQEDIEEAIDFSEKEEEWIQYIKRSTKEAEEYMKMKIPCWIETHRRLKWRMASRIPSLPKERWTNKKFDWHPGLDNTIKTRRLVGRPKRRWEDDINEFTRPEEVKEGNRHDLMNNINWMTEGKNNKKWNGKDERFIKNQQQTHWTDVQNRSSECFVLAHPTQS